MLDAQPVQAFQRFSGGWPVAQLLSDVLSLPAAAGDRLPLTTVTWVPFLRACITAQAHQQPICASEAGMPCRASQLTGSL